MTPLHLERTLDVDLGGWAVYYVRDAAGGLVGGVFEHHEQLLDATFGPATWIATVFQWRSPGHPTPQAALEAIADHLARARNR